MIITIRSKFIQIQKLSLIQTQIVLKTKKTILNFILNTQSRLVQVTKVGPNGPSNERQLPKNLQENGNDDDPTGGFAEFMGFHSGFNS